MNLAGKVAAINSTAISVRWKPPANKDRNGLIRGYQIHVQEVTGEGDLVSEPKRYDVADENAEEYNVTKLQPETLYAVQVAAVTRKVPTRPELGAQLIQEEPNLVAQIQWSRPTNIYGQLVNYKLRYGRSDTQQMEERTINPLDQVHQIPNLDRGARYEFYLSGKNNVGWGQEAFTYLDTPEGVPTAPPQNLSRRLQSPTGVVITWNPPVQQFRNGHVTHYGIKFHKSSDGSVTERNTTETRMVFSNLDENTEYTFQVNAYTKKDLVHGVQE
ncbi:tyrosine-protein phosphatase Lar [Caerostris extrusa]|uniref:Tyrosine-protein phosphatase Lar n=1 Tax=Caerostris extrusa TaxID=172846 RepID=A0AAV4M8D7_CAEEX|nr:tyrosine-protein phosphatase Lar [Caerostris extrusa]